MATLSPQHIFQVDPIDFPNLPTAYASDGKRYYQTPMGKWYASVTTFLGHFSRDDIAKWRARVGEAEATRICTQAAARGEAVHKMAERYLLGVRDYTEGYMPCFVEKFLEIKPLLDKHVTKVYAVEAPMYSDILRLAGRCDVIAEWDGVPAILDFKTKDKHHDHGFYAHHFVQGAAYAVMVKERAKLDVNRVVLLMTFEKEVEALPLISTRDEHLPELVEKLKQWRLTRYAQVTF